jgi:ATP-binding cassette subfamily G (WHITE) protein 2 (PDR)
MTVLYGGRQIYFGPAQDTKAFFTEMGFGCAPRQTDADFLTSLTSGNKRLIREGFEGKTLRTSEDFANTWKASKDYSTLTQEIENYEKYPLGGKSVDEFTASRRSQQAVQ